ncbi:MAG: AbrB family transcriptional regulator [Synechococcaceae bacterium WB4_1_0192]|jgi:hypothetical protein|nr:AbrB family transcriptional regulator [Synechococcaceae bacterium WB4_1_0192]
MLQGTELLNQLRSAGPCSRGELVRRCGYVHRDADGREHLRLRAFYEELLAAVGIHLGDGRGSGRRRGRQLTYRSHVHFNGNLMVGNAYTRLLDLQPGDQLEIHPEGRGFRLIRR